MKKPITALFDGLRWTGNVYKSLLMSLLLVMALYTLCRIGFYFFNKEFFAGITFSNFLYLLWGGLRFDLSAVLYINLLFILLLIVPLDYRFHPVFQKGLRYLFVVTNAVGLAANVSDFIYYRFTLRRTTADVFQQFENEQNLGMLFFHFLIDYWYALLFWIVLLFILAKGFGKTARIEGPLMRNRKTYYISGLAGMLLIAYLVVGGLRGGFRESTRPITLSNAGEYVNNPKDISIVLNTPFAIFRTLGKTKVQHVDYFTEEEASAIYSPVHHGADSAAFRYDNVVVIILESFSKEFFGAFNADKENGTYRGYTPFLDSLLQYSKSFTWSFANGRKSIDGMPSVISGIPSLGVPYFLSPYAANQINSLPLLLKEKGYYSAFFHGAPNGSMGFQAYANMAGFDAYYGMSEYGNDDDFDGIWGIWDDKFFGYFADRLNTFHEPFVSVIFSVSSHHPFKVPEAYEGRFKGGPQVIDKCIEYTDHSLRMFFNKASRMPWYDRTLFVFTADHCSSEKQFPEGRTAWGQYSVPIIFFKPDHSLQGMEPYIAQQIDIMPSVLGYLGYDSDYVAFGRDVFHDTTTPFAFNYNDNMYQLTMGDHLLMFDGTKSVGLYNYKQDKMLTKNLVGAAPHILAAMERMVKAMIQQYNNRMVEDRLTAVSAFHPVTSIK